MDGLANHEEPGQRVDEFVRSSPNVPDRRKNKLYLMPIGDSDRDAGPPIAKLAEFARAFFGLETAILPRLDLRRTPVKRRRLAGTNAEQVLTTDVLALLKRRLPDDAFALLGVTMADLYPAPEWNYVFGQASLRDRVGIYSFVRYDSARSGERVQDGAGLLLRRSCQILAHEGGHMFGIQHCIWYRCVMNGSNHLPEFDSQPLHLCPVDMRKLQWSVRFDPVERYKRLLAFYERERFRSESDWLRPRLKMLETNARN